MFFRFFSNDSGVNQPISPQNDGTQTDMEQLQLMQAVAGNQAIIEFTPHGVISDVNQRFLNLTGYSRDELIGKNYSFIVASDEPTNADISDIWTSVGRGMVANNEFQCAHKMGDTLAVAATYYPVCDMQGSPIKVFAILVQLAELTAKVTQKNGYISAIQRSQAVIEFNTDGTITDANENFLQAMGYRIEEIRGQKHSIFVDPQYRTSTEYHQFWSNLNAGKFDSGEFKRVTKSGKDIWIQATYNPIFDSAGKVVKVVKFATDITEKKIQSFENKSLVAAIDTSQARIEFELDGTIIFANENFLQVTGYRLGEIVGKHHRIFLDNEYANSKEYKDFWKRLGSGQQLKGQFRRIAKDGSEIWIEASYNHVLDNAGKPLKVVKFATDITERKQQQQRRKIDANNAMALKLVQTSVILLNQDLEIVFANRAAQTFLERKANDFRTVNKYFDSRKIIGEKIYSFHPNPKEKRRKLSSLSQSTREEFIVGGCVIVETLSPWLSDNGSRLGVVVEWVDKSDEVEIEREIDDILSSARSGDFSRQVRVEGKQGFFERLAQGLNDLNSTVEVALNDIMRMLGAMSRGNLSERITRDYRGTFGQMKDDANATADKLTEMISNIRTSAASISSAANEIAQGNTNLSARTEQQAASLEETASSMEQMNSTVKQSAENAQRANSMALEAQEKAKIGGDVVSNAVASMEEINKSSKQISDIIGVIDEIAFQTNLLALNAAVEAARAGEQGRGFAVVAGEVRNLAQRSAAAAKEIKDLIRDSVNKVHDGTQLVNQSGKTLSDIVSSVEKVSVIIGDIANATSEQTAGISQVNTAVSQIDEMTQQNAALVEEAAAAGEALSEQAIALESVLGFFSGGETPVSSHGGYAQRPINTAQLNTSSNLNKTFTDLTSSSSGGSQSDDEWEDF